MVLNAVYLFQGVNTPCHEKATLKNLPYRKVMSIVDSVYTEPKTAFGRF
jgi:hypothetical protein